MYYIHFVSVNNPLLSYKLDKELQFKKGIKNFYITNLPTIDDIINFLESQGDKYKNDLMMFKATKETRTSQSFLVGYLFVADKPIITVEDFVKYYDKAYTFPTSEIRIWLSQYHLFEDGLNYIVICLSRKYQVGLGEKEYFMKVYCSKPLKIYYFNKKFYTSEKEYLSAKQNLIDSNNKYLNTRIRYIQKRLAKYGIEDYLQKVGEYVKDFILKHYKPTLQENVKQVFIPKIVQSISSIPTFKIYKSKRVIGKILTKDDIYYLVEYYAKPYIITIENKYKQSIIKKQQYQQEALQNYGKLKQDFENYKKQCEIDKQKISEKTKSNRQKAFNLTIKLTKIIGQVKGKENKLAMLDKVEQILDKRYSPDKFSNQELISFVRDYLKVIRLAIELSE